MRYISISALLLLLTFASAQALEPPSIRSEEGDYIAHDFKFRSGETLAEMRLHYTTLGTPERDAQGHVVNAVLILHGTGGDGHQFLRPQFAGVLFPKGGLLDPQRYFIVLDDGIGHGKSSKPSDGLRAHFPQYDYDDMVAAQHLVLTQALHIDHLRLVMGTSMGCMQTFVWGETYPDFMDALMPLACNPVEIAGRNRMWRKMTMDAIRDDPAWAGGNYKTEPREGLRTAIDLLIIAGSAPQQLQKSFPTRDAADKDLDAYMTREFATLDANDFLYQVNASRNYNPWPSLEKIKVPLMWINSADDFINPPELDIAPEAIKRIAKGRFVLIAISDQTHGHGTHTYAAVWQSYLAELLKSSERH